MSICLYCNATFKSTKALNVHIKEHFNTVHSFGMEIIEPLINKMTLQQLKTFIEFPEDAITVDLPNLVFFNLDYPQNQTIQMYNGSIFVHNNEKWKSIDNVVQFLKVCFQHYKKCIDFCKKKNITITPVQKSLIDNYIYCIDNVQEIDIAPNCPLHSFTQKISPVDMTNAILKTIYSNFKLPKEDWVTTIQYCNENLD